MSSLHAKPTTHPAPVPAPATASGVKRAALRGGPGPVSARLVYLPKSGISSFAWHVQHATPMQLVVAEREGVSGLLLKDLARTMQVPTSRFYDMLGIPKATAEKKAQTDLPIAGAGGHAALGVVRLLGMAQAMVEDSTAPEAPGFDVARWLGEWLDQPQPALGGARPSEFLDTPTGVELVAKVLGAMESGSYQ